MHHEQIMMGIVVSPIFLATQTNSQVFGAAVHSNGFNSPSMVGINSETVG